tara:strand:- start:640 stop:1476 length:837 start_codon:yes stop_codon:yes gene_type:complete
LKKYYIKDIQGFKKESKPFATITAYDYTSSSICSSLGFPLILVGDSASMVVFGYENTTPITMDEMMFVLRAVVRGNSCSLIVADMPFLSYQPSKRDAIKNAGRFIKAGANAVKLEGGKEVLNKINALVDSGIPVVGHIGLQPQSINTMSGYKIQGKTKKSAQKLINEAIEIENAGAFSLVLEGIPSNLAKIISKKIKIPTIGIGSGPDCDGQIQVFHDVLGLFDNLSPKHAKKFLDGNKHLAKGLKKYKKSVEKKLFPSSKNYINLTSKILEDISENI